MNIEDTFESTKEKKYMIFLKIIYYKNVQSTNVTASTQKHTSQNLILNKFHFARFEMRRPDVMLP